MERRDGESGGVKEREGEAAGKTEMLEATESQRERESEGEKKTPAAGARTFPLFYRGETFLEFGCLVSRLTFRVFAFY